MAFNKFKSIADVQSAYDIRHVWANFITDVPSEPSETFINDLNFKYENIDIFGSETSRKENIIYPLLLDLYREHYKNLALWSEYYIHADEVLYGHPDYMLSARSELGNAILSLPILTIVEAKEYNFKQGWGQCLAAMVAAQKLNAAEEKQELTIYGESGVLYDFRFG